MDLSGRRGICRPPQISRGAVMTADTKGDGGVFRDVFDAFPSIVLIVDDDVRIQEYNLAAADLLISKRQTVLRQRAGEILHCIHTTEVPGGCGKAPFCRNCIIRDSVVQACKGRRVVRRRARLEFVRDAAIKEIYALVTASPLAFQDRRHALLVIEDISELADLHRIIPICSVCGKIRDDTESWMRVEAYFKNNWDVDFSHGYCPDCYEKEITKFKNPHS